MLPANMSRGDILGGSDHLTMAVVARLRDKDGASLASGIAVQKELAEKTGARESLAMICAILDRLEKRAFLTSKASDRDGRKRVFTLTPSGEDALLAARNAIDAVWSDLRVDKKKRPRLNLRIATQTGKAAPSAKVDALKQRRC